MKSFGSGRVAQLVRAPASHAGGHRFESCRAHHTLASTSGDLNRYPPPISSSPRGCDKKVVEAVAKTQRRRAHRTPADSSVVHVEMKDGMGSTRWVTANLVDVLSDGCGLALMNFLKSGSTVVVRGRLGADRAGNHLKAGVRWCVAKTDGTFRAGLEFLDSPSAFSQDEEQAESAVTQDCYEVMQLSPNADPDTI